MKNIDKIYLNRIVLDKCPRLIRPDDYIRYIHKHVYSRQYRVYWASLDDRHYQIS